MDRAQIAIEAANLVADGSVSGCCEAFHQTAGINENVDSCPGCITKHLFADAIAAESYPLFWWPTTTEGRTARVIALCLYSLLIQDGQA